MIVQGYRKGQPFDLEVMPIDDHGHVLEVSAAKAFLAMRADAAEDGVPLPVVTAWRSMEYQTRLWARYQASLTKWEAGGRLGAKPPPAAPPGFSTHQEGKSIDINRAPGDDLKTKEHDSPADKWLQANARRFGYVNDVKSECWHWTYSADPATALS